ncbi:hypothetical protein JK635_02380 [Neobacillus sp. YIM B02564]|uniref:Uncharacterized protein n=1 Tax=Neobacillus paridis TaxID=2803862 RepID=A0ABS1TIJ6_9BACI|nr:hypothetical protein [Neobacillus paridis]MBL4951087.1 hypothetical protein [Neobacillus paridis]
MSKIAEFEHQLAEVETKIYELKELRNDLYTRIDEEREKENEELSITLNRKELHKLLAVFEHSIISTESVKNKKSRIDLIEFKSELSWMICDLLGYNTYEGSIDPDTLEYYTFKSTPTEFPSSRNVEGEANE